MRLEDLFLWGQRFEQSLSPGVAPYHHDTVYVVAEEISFFGLKERPFYPYHGLLALPTSFMPMWRLRAPAVLVGQARRWPCHGN
jgi:hypothetical protein